MNKLIKKYMEQNHDLMAELGRKVLEEAIYDDNGFATIPVNATDIVQPSMNYFHLVDKDEIITVRQGMDDIPELQYSDDHNMVDALECARQANIGWSDDRWMIFGVRGCEVDQLVDEDGVITGFLYNSNRIPTPEKFALPNEEDFITPDCDLIPF
jgi:hypothetical protein